MIDRDLDLKRIRPDFLTTTINNQMTTEERFQNLVLRPIIKLQNDLFIEVFKRIPKIVSDWNIVKSISYFKVEQMLDSDLDLIPDKMENDYGTNRLNPDSDWDGHSDGLEVLNAHSPIGRD
jgi:hypothetical protein